MVTQERLKFFCAPEIFSCACMKQEFDLTAWLHGIPPAICVSPSLTCNICMMGFDWPTWLHGRPPAICASPYLTCNICMKGFDLLAWLYGFRHASVVTDRQYVLCGVTDLKPMMLSINRAHVHTSVSIAQTVPVKASAKSAEQSLWTNDHTLCN